MCGTLFRTFLCRRFARLQRETSRHFLVTRFMEEMSYVFLFTFFLLPLIFSLHWWPLSFLISSPPLQNFLCCSSNQKCFLCFLSLALAPFAVFLVELRWPVDHFLFISFFPFLYIPNLWTINRQHG